MVSALLRLFSEEENYIYEWGEFLGDKRALNPIGRKLISKDELPPPSQEYLIKLTTEKLINNLVGDIKNIIKKELNND